MSLNNKLNFNVINLLMWKMKLGVIIDLTSMFLLKRKCALLALVVANRCNGRLHGAF